MSSVIQVSTKFAFVALLAFSVLVEVLILPLLAGGALSAAGGNQALLPFIVVWGVLVTLPFQAMIIIAWRLTSFARDKRIFSAEAERLVRALVAMPMITTALLFAGFIAANIFGYTPPIIMYGLLGAMSLTLTIGLVLITMRRLLARATTLSNEMDQVV